MTEAQNSQDVQSSSKEGVTQTGTGTNINITLSQDSVERVAASIRQNGMMLGAAAVAVLLMSFLFSRYAAQSELQTYQFNLLRSCLQSGQCDVQKVLSTLDKEK